MSQHHEVDQTARSAARPAGRALSAVALSLMRTCGISDLVVREREDDEVSRQASERVYRPSQRAGARTSIDDLVD